MPIEILTTYPTPSDVAFATGTITFDCNGVPRQQWTQSCTTFTDTFNYPNFTIPIHNHMDPTRPTLRIAAAVVHRRELDAYDLPTVGNGLAFLATVPGQQFVDQFTSLPNGATIWQSTFPTARGLTQYRVDLFNGKPNVITPYQLSLTFRQSHPTQSTIGSGLYVPISANGQQTLNNLGMPAVRGYYQETNLPNPNDGHYLEPYYSTNRMVRTHKTSAPTISPSYTQSYTCPLWKQLASTWDPGGPVGLPATLMPQAKFNAGTGDALLFSDGAGSYWQNGIQRCAAWAACHGNSAVASRTTRIPLTRGLPAPGQVMLAGGAYSTAAPGSVKVTFYDALGNNLGFQTAATTAPIYLGLDYYSTPRYSHLSTLDLSAITIPANARTCTFTLTNAGSLYSIGLEWSHLTLSGGTIQSDATRAMALGFYPDPIPQIDIETGDWQTGLVFDIQ